MLFYGYSFQDQGSFYSLPLYRLSYRINCDLYTAPILWSRILFSKIWVAIKFLGIYLYQLITSSLSIIKYILFKTKDMNPGLLTYETELKVIGPLHF